jgi:hypothetical protein
MSDPATRSELSLAMENAALAYHHAQNSYQKCVSDLDKCQARMAKPRSQGVLPQDGIEYFQTK